MHVYRGSFKKYGERAIARHSPAGSGQASYHRRGIYEDEGRAHGLPVSAKPWSGIDGNFPLPVEQPANYPPTSLSSAPSPKVFRRSRRSTCRYASRPSFPLQHLRLPPPWPSTLTNACFIRDKCRGSSMENSCLWVYFAFRSSRMKLATNGAKEFAPRATETKRKSFIISNQLHSLIDKDRWYICIVSYWDSGWKLERFSSGTFFGGES